MKKILLLSAVTALFFACGSPEEKAVEYPKNNDWNSQNLKGTVKMVETVSYTPDSTGAIGAPDSCCASVEMFDEQGYSTNYERKTAAGTISESSTMTRYEGGQMKEMINMRDGKQSMRFAIDIDADGKYTKASRYDSTNTMDLYYDGITENEFGAVLTGTGHKPDGSVSESFVNKQQGALYIGGIGKDSTGKTTFESTVELNDKGDMVKSTTMNVGKDSTTTKVETMTYDAYDEQGNWTQRTTYDDKGKATKVEKRTITYYEKKE